jgi:GTPase SAR1 family protein
MIILEGPDGAGKTTLLLNLLDEFPSIEQHEKASTPTGGPVDNIAQWAKDDIKSWPAQPLSFYDRHPMISEPIYGSILRGTYDKWFQGADAQRVGQKMMLQGLVVFCLPSIETVIENLDAEEQLAGVEDNIGQLWGSYSAHLDYFATRFPNSVFHFDYNRPTDFDELHTLIEAHQVRYNRRNKGLKA